MSQAKHKRGARNNRLYDRWSLVHLLTGIGLGWIMAPLVALGIMVIYEPVEIFILSPLLWRIGVKFGYESWRNSFSDIVFDAVGVSAGATLLASIAIAPFHLF